jgi:hypothetical protein
VAFHLKRNAQASLREDSDQARTMLYSAATMSITEFPMAESPKRTKIKATWSDVKAKVSEFDKAGLIQLVAELYSFHKDNQSFLHARFSLGPNPLDDYRKKIAVALAPDVHGKRNGKISVAEAKKAISAYCKAVGDPKGVLELRLFWCETAVQFSMDFGFADDGYFDALVLQYREACQVLSSLDETLLENTIERLTNIRDDAQMGYGVGDYMGDVLGEALLNLPTPQIEARVPQLDD